jgi:transcription elongation factor Elf1
MSKTSETINSMKKEINYYSDWTDKLTLEQLDLKREIRDFKFIIEMLEQGISYSDCKKVMEIRKA